MSKIEPDRNAGVFTVRYMAAIWTVVVKNTIYLLMLQINCKLGVSTAAAAQTLIRFHTTVSIAGEWLEAFWCDRCQTTQWYYVCKTGDRLYEVAPAPRELWQRVAGVVHPNGNPSVGEFTRREARIIKYEGVKHLTPFGSVRWERLSTIYCIQLYLCLCDLRYRILADLL